MKRKAISDDDPAVVSGTTGGVEGSCTAKHGAQFIAARDSRNRRISGLSVRNGRFYATLWADRGDGQKTARRFPLLDGGGEPIRALPAAREGLVALKANRRENSLPAPGHKPSFEAFADSYIELQSTRAKKARTQNNEVQALARWKAHLAGVKINKITTPLIAAYKEARLRGCVLGVKKFEAAAPRTVLLDLIVLRGVLKAAAESGHLRDLPAFPKVKVPPAPRRALISPEQFQTLLDACIAMKKDGKPVTLNGEQLRDFLRLLAYCGAREQEALAIKWAHVDFNARRLYVGAPEDFIAAAFTIGTGGTSKNRGSRVVDFNEPLEDLLRDMNARRVPDSAFLFPSPRRGKRDVRATNLRKSLRAARNAAGVPAAVSFHHLRVYFISHAVMAGIDFMTIAKWVGHSDGGILIGKTYGDIADQHRTAMAAKINFGGVR